MARAKQKAAPEIKLPPELSSFDPFADSWFDRAYDASLTDHDSSSLAHGARALWRKARTAAGATEHPLHDWMAIRLMAAEYLESKGHDPEVWYTTVEAGN